MSSPYKEIAIREAWKKSVQLQGASREYYENWSSLEPVSPQNSLDGLKD